MTNIRENYPVHPRSLLCAHGERQHHCSSSSGATSALLKALTQFLPTSQNGGSTAMAPSGPGLASCLLNLLTEIFPNNSNSILNCRGLGRGTFLGEMSKNEKEQSK